MGDVVCGHQAPSIRWCGLGMMAGWGRLKDSDGEKKGKREKSKKETEKGDLLCSCVLLLLAFFK